MPIVQSGFVNSKWLDIISDAFAEIGVYAQGEAISANDASYAQRKLNRLLDAWDANEFYIFSKTFQTYSIPTGQTLNPDGSVSFTIGLAANSPTFNVPSGSAGRPVRIASANIILTTVSPFVKSPLEIRGREWWHSQRVPGVSTQVPSDLYYEPAWPNGLIYLWPVASLSYLLEVELETQISQVTSLAAAFSMPPAYEKAIVLSLAEDMGPAYGSPIDVSAAAAKARAEAQSPNLAAPKMNLAAGTPSGSKGLPSFNFRTGSSR